MNPPWAMNSELPVALPKPTSTVDWLEGEGDTHSVCRMGEGEVVAGACAATLMTEGKKDKER